MSRRISILVFLILSIASLTLNLVAQKKEATKSKLISPNTKSVVEIEDVKLDKNHIESWCPIDSPSNLCPKDKMNVRVTTLVKNTKNESLTYYYNVSGGRIIGQGAEVTWDFTDLKPGQYSVAVGVGKGGIIYGNVIIKTIDLQECSVCDPPHYCPAVAVSEPTELAKPGDLMIFTANVTGGEKNASYSYEWTIASEGTSNPGKIIYGQGTPQIIVKTDSDLNNYYITAAVKIGGVFPSCNDSATGTGSVSKREN